jgi:hypothetical protein
MSSADTLYLASLILAAAAAISGLFMIKSVREGDVAFAWNFAAVFVVSSLLAALFFFGGCSGDAFIYLQSHQYK